MLLMSLVLGSLAEYTVYIVLSIPHYSMVPRKPENRLKSRKDLDLSTALNVFSEYFCPAIARSIMFWSNDVS